MNPPFAPHGAISTGMGMLAAIVIGTGFGFFLERAGLGNARKLSAQFYLTDLAVFKVMFSAIVTAMLGLFWLSRTGLMDLSGVRMLPTFLVPQTVGGLIFGVGFVVGGYCPGTCCIAAATGRMDGLVNLLGILAGIALFGELYPSLESFYSATSLGEITVPQLLRLPPSAVVAGIVLLAVAGFVLAGRLERRGQQGEPGA